MIVEALLRTHELILRTPDQEFSRFEECDLHRLLVYRYLSQAMQEMRLHESTQREIIAAFRNLGAELAEPEALREVRRGLPPELRQVTPSDPLKRRTLRALSLAIRLARWRWPRRMTGWPATPAHAAAPEATPRACGCCDPLPIPAPSLESLAGGLL